MSNAKSIIHTGDCIEVLKGLPDASVQCVITSPPYYGLRDYGSEEQIGLEKTPEEYVAKMVEVFREVRRVLRDDGTVWLNIGDSYWSDSLARATPIESMWGKRPASDLTKGRENIPTHNKRGGLGQRPNGIKPKDLMGIPWMLAFALRADGWYLRQDIIWHKPNPMPEAVKDRCTKAHEYVFLLSKSQRYYYDAEAVREPEVCGRMRGPALHRDTVSTNGNSGLARRESDGFRNRRSVWTITTKPFKGAHFAVMPEALVEPCILAGSKAGDTILDPFTGSGTVAVVAERHGRSFVGAELNPDYVQIAYLRIAGARIATQMQADTEEGT